VTKNLKSFQTLIVKNNQSFKKSRFNVFQNICKMRKISPFIEDLIISTHPRFHAMVVRGQPNTQNPNENIGAQK
jgi:hypothetical protein